MLPSNLLVLYREMFRIELTYFIVLAVIIITSEFMPTSLLMQLDHIMVRIAMVLLLLFLISKGPTAGILGLMAIAVIYLERNRRKVGVVAAKINQMDIFRSANSTVEEEGIPQKTVPVKPFDKPKEEESNYLPPQEADCDITNFEPVAPTINEKAVLSTIYPLDRNGDASAAAQLYEEMGVGHL